MSALLRLSRALTGEHELDDALTAGFMTRIRATSEGAHLDRLLSTFEAIEEAGGDQPALIKARIMDDGALRALAKMIIVLWYTGDLETTDTTESEASEREYFSGVLWRIARAHPPGLSGGYFGHWTYPPDGA